MTLKEAQNASVSGVAVLGNHAMADIIWPKDSPHPFFWLTNGYLPKPDKAEWCRGKEWEPLHRAYKEREQHEVAAKDVSSTTV